MTTHRNGPTHKMIWINIIFFSVTTLVAVIGAPLYIHRYGLQPFDFWLMAFYAIASSMGITVGYHRLFAHATFKANRVVQFLLLFFGAAAFEQSALDWSSQHRDHHRFVDTELDPYSIKKGFFYAHIGWLIFWKHTIHHENAKDLQANPLIDHQSRYYHAWAIVSGIVLPVLLGCFFSSGLSAFIFAVCVRLTAVYHGTFCINSVCHMFGKATYDIHSTAKDHWLVAYATNGEGYHNFHHRFPSDYRNGVRWHQWDPSKWCIAALSRFHLAWDLRKVSKFKILEARLLADQQRVRNWIDQAKDAASWQHLHRDLEDRYKILRQRLAAWEQRSNHNREIVYGEIRHRSQVLSYMARKKIFLAKRRFQQAREDWQLLVQSNASLAAALC